VEKNSVGPGIAEGPKKLDRWGVKHEVVALILTGIRGSTPKRRRPPYKPVSLRGSVRMGGTPPGILYEYQKKGVTEFAFRKSLILKGAILVVLNWQEAEMGALKKEKRE
jgi:hypothetical protein